jgi:hypothetical protein
MKAIIIRSDNKNIQIFSDLAKKLGADVVPITIGQYEDFVFGSLIDKATTGKNVSRNKILKKLVK